MLNINPKHWEKTAIFIPTYNAMSTLPKVIERIPEIILHSVGEILIVDNCSTDNTLMISKEIQQKFNSTKFEIIQNSKNLGYGGSQKIAYKHCIDKGYQAVVMLHSDGQYPPELMNRLIEKIYANEADLIFGSRMSGHPLKGGMPIIRFLGNRFLTITQNLLLNTSLSEYHSGYRAFAISALKKVMLDRLSSDYHFDTEILIAFLHNKLRITEVAIPTYYGDEKNYVNIWKYGFDVLITSLAYFFHKVSLRKSRRWSERLDG